jgi:hypothetical protein
VVFLKRFYFVQIKMKRNKTTFSLYALLFLAVGFLTVFKLGINNQVAHAQGSPGCPADDPCVFLVVKLNPVPSSKASVVATRKADASIDDNVTLVAQNNGTYKSSHPIAHSSASGSICTGVTQQKFFDVEVSGSATGALSSLNMCANASPKAVNGVKTVTIDVSTDDHPGGKGGIKGTLKIKVPSGDTIACPSGGFTLNGKFNDDISVGSGGKFNSGLIINPGTYDIEIECPYQNNPYSFKINNVKVEAGKITNLGTITSDGQGSDNSDEDAKKACKDYAPGGSKHNNTHFQQCLDGYADGLAGKSKDEACGGSKYTDGSDSQDACLVGFNAAAGTNEDDDESVCLSNSHTSLEWIVCPLITALSKGANELNNKIMDQLNFETDKFLPDDGGVHKAWNVIKVLVSSLLIILLLVMVISQAVGSGVFEAYTVRKVLPRLVLAVVFMQLSWEICIFFVHIANDLGNGLARIIAAPFGGQDKLQLAALLQSLGTGAVVGTEIALTGVLVSSVFLTPLLGPGVLLVGFSIFMAVAVALASILIRNIVIIFCVMLAPLAILLWVMPNQGLQRYWKMWSENFSKALLLFPLMVGIIYAGRIFAYVAGTAGGGGAGDSNVGFLNTILILVGFFAPYFLLTKAFKWGGSMLSAGAGLASSNWAVKRGGELGRKELREHMERKQGERAKDYDPTGPMIGLKRGKFGMPVATGRLATRVQSGSFMPTARGRNLTIGRGAKWKNDRNEEAENYIKRVGEVAMVQGYTAKDGTRMLPGVKSQKQAIADLAAYTGGEDAKKRAGQAAIKWLMRDSNSWYELQNTHFHTDDKNSDTAGMNGKRIYESPLWEGTLMTNPDVYGPVVGKRPDLAPHVLQSTYGDSMDKVVKNFDRLRTSEDDKAKVLEFYKDPKNKGKELRLTDADRMSHTILEYMDAGNYGSVAQGLWQEAATLAQGDASKGIPAHPQISATIKAELGNLEGIQAQNIIGGLKSGSVRGDIDKAIGGNGSGAEIDKLYEERVSGLSDAGAAATAIPAAPTRATAEAAERAATAAGTAGAAATAAAAAGTGAAIGAAAGSRAAGSVGAERAPSTGGLEPLLQEVRGLRREVRESGGMVSPSEPSAAREFSRTEPRTEVIRERVVPLGGGGELRIQHPRSQDVTPGGVVLPTGTRDDRPREE